jgi:cell division protein FtsB
MSEPKKYICTSVLGMFEMQEAINGDWVGVADYNHLKAECQARQAENSVLAVECDSLKAEVERLTEELTLAKQLQAKYMTPEVRKAIVREAKKNLRSYGIK